jgi:hypothetical protein
MPHSPSLSLTCLSLSIRMGPGGATRRGRTCEVGRRDATGPSGGGMPSPSLSYLKSMEDPSLTFSPSQIQRMAAVVAESGVKGNRGGRIRRRSSPPFLCSLGWLETGSQRRTAKFSDAMGPGGGGSSASRCGDTRSMGCSPGGSGPDLGPVRAG